MQTLYSVKSLKIIFGLIVLTTAISINPAFSVDRFRTDPDIEGKVMDFDTKEPIPGAVVMAMWTTNVFRLTIEPDEKYYDYFETLSNEKGEFKILGKGLTLFKKINPPKIRIFKAGYPFLSLHHYDHYSGTDYPECEPKILDIEWVNGKLIIFLRKRPIDERKESMRQRRSIPFYQMAGEGIPASKEDYQRLSNEEAITDTSIFQSSRLIMIPIEGPQNSLTNLLRF